MEHRALLRFLIIFLIFSNVFSSRIFPQSAGFLKSDNEDLLIQELEQGIVEERKYNKGSDWEETMIRGRMDIETNDYSEAGANNDHTPNTPGGR